MLSLTPALEKRRQMQRSSELSINHALGANHVFVIALENFTGSHVQHLLRAHD